MALFTDSMRRTLRAWGFINEFDQHENAYLSLAQILANTSRQALLTTGVFVSQSDESFAESVLVGQLATALLSEHFVYFRRVLRRGLRQYIPPGQYFIWAQMMASFILQEAIRRGMLSPGASDVSQAELPIEQTQAAIEESLRFYSCFISYSTEDEEFCQFLNDRLNKAGLRTWYSPKDIEGGKKLRNQIDEAILSYDKLLLVLSKDSMNSKWVKHEISRALEREEKEHRLVLFPIRLVSYEGFFIPDFSDWRTPSSFEKGFNRLLQNLRNAEEEEKNKERPLPR
jgi:TIR domain-containing protein